MHHRAALAPVSRFSTKELTDSIEAMKDHLAHSPPMTAVNLVPAPDVDTSVTQDHGSKESFEQRAPSLSAPGVYHDPATFGHYWSKGFPIVVTDVDPQLRGVWGPAYFIEQYGRHKVTIQDCESHHTTRSTVAEFFRDFGTPDERARIYKLKVRFFLLIASPP